jgi:hypothetical protein
MTKDEMVLKLIDLAYHWTMHFGRISGYGDTF